MFAWKHTAWMQNNTAQIEVQDLDARTSGLVAGTKIATKSGWTPVENVQVGQTVLTFDRGLQTVVSVTRNVLLANGRDIDSFPMTVPAGALGNLEAMKILPHQPVMIESDMAEDMTGDPFALIPASALGGVRGITQDRPQQSIEVIQLHFAQDEIVFANIGALFLCRQQADLASDAAETGYDVLSLDLAWDLACYWGQERHSPLQASNSH